MNRLKDLDKPTIILISGSSGVGKSKLARMLSDNFAIGTSFSTDVGAREPIREGISWITGDFPPEEYMQELYSSSFSGGKLKYYYVHAIQTMIAVKASIIRLIKQNESAIIEGVPLMPGLLDDKNITGIDIFEEANIVQIVVCIEDREMHERRFSNSNRTQRGGLKKYLESGAFNTTREIHDQLVKMANMTDSAVVDNSENINRTLYLMSQKISGPYADRGLGVEDIIRDNVVKNIEKRKNEARERIVTEANQLGKENR